MSIIKYGVPRIPPEFPDIIIGDEEIRRGLEAGRGLDEMEAGWQGELEGFLAIRKQYLLY